VIDQDSFIGIVEHRHSRGSIPSATVVPLYRLAPDGHTWHSITETERKRDFPNSGCVSWIYVPDVLSEGSVWRFRIESQPSYDANPEDSRRDRYKVAFRSERQLFAVLDIDHFGGEPLGRERLCSHGVRLHCVGPTRIFVRAEEKLWCLLPFVPKEGQQDLHVIDPSALEKPLRFQAYISPDSTWTLPIPGEARTFFLPEFSSEGTVVLRDWSPDSIVLKRVMVRLRKWDRGFADTLTLSEKAIERVGAILEASPTSVNDLDMERARFRRAHAYLTSIRDAGDLALAARAAIEEGPLATLIEQEKKQLLEAETQKARKQAEETIQVERDALDRVRQQIADLEKKRKEAVAALESMRQKQANFLDRLDEELDSNLTRILAKPEQVLADVAILKVIEKVVGSNAGSRKAEPPLRLVSQVIRPVKTQLITAYTDLVTFTNEFQRALLASDTPRNTWRAVFSSLLGGGVPLLAGARARNSFEAFARVATRGEIHWIQVEPTWNSLRDAMEGGLGELLVNLGRNGSLQLVVLEGVNRAPVESYLCPLLSHYANVPESRASDDLMPVADDMNRNSAQLHPHAWPGNVLLGGTVIEGMTSLGLPASCLSGCTLVLTDEIRAGAELDLLSKEHPSLRGRNGAATGVGEIPLDVWSSWREQATNVDLSAPIEHWGRLASDYGLSRLTRDRYLATYAASRLVADSNDPAIVDAFSHVMLPVIAASNQRHDLGDLTLEYRDLERVVELIQKLLRS